jgi:crotonobetainyl-CoA:carnitine CoA-transferase CaiB-like acyl-CoA transferase
MTEHLLLSDIRVLELGHIVAGPSAGLLFAEMGADVIKVEHPKGGDQARARPDQAILLTLNRNKRSMALDLKHPEGKKIFSQLLKGADVVVDNFAPGALERLGFSYEEMSKENPRVIHCSIKGFLPGLYEDRPLLDEPAQMMGGLAYMTGPPGQPLRAGASVIDIGAAMFGVIGILAALNERHHTGRGQCIRSGLFETVVFLVGQHMTKAAVTGRVPSPVPEKSIGKDMGWGIYRIFITKDQRQLFVGVTSDAHWERFCHEFQVTDLWEDVSLRTNQGRVQQHILVNDRVKQIVAGLPLDSLVERFEKGQIPYSIVNTPMDLFQDPHLRARDHFIKVTAANGATIEVPRLPMTFSSGQSALRINPPKLGEHTVQIMQELGYSSEEIASLMQEGVIKEPSSN